MAALAEANPRPDELLEAVERPPLLRFAELLEAADPPLEDFDAVPLLEPLRLDEPPLLADFVAPFEDLEAALDAPFEVPPREEEPREDELLDADLDVDLVAVFEEDRPPELLDAAFFGAAFFVDFAMFNEFLIRLINFSLQITTM